MQRLTQNGLAIFFLVLIGLLGLGRCLDNEFTNWDDPAEVLINPFLIKPLSYRQIASIFAKPVPIGGLGQYHPLVTLTYALERRFYGVSPFPYHLHNLIFHLVNGVLVFCLLLRLTGRRSSAFFGALIFLIHPFQTQSTAWIAGRKDLVYTFFYLLSLLTYLDYLRKPRSTAYVLSLVLFFFSFLSKSAAITLPLVLIVCDYWWGRKARLRIVAGKAPFLLIALIGAIIVFKTQLTPDPGIRLHSEFSWGNAFLASRAVIFYLFRFLFPFKLSPCYPFTANMEFVSSQYILSFAAIIALLALVARRAVTAARASRRSRLFTFGAFFFLVTILPVTRLIPLGGNEIVALRYLYLPMAGLALIAGLGLPAEFSTRGRNGLIMALFTVAAVFLFALSNRACGVWRNSGTFWRQVIKYYPEYDLAHHQLGLALYQGGDYAGALFHCNRAIGINPAIAYAYMIKGLSQQKMGDYSAAENSFLEGIKVLRKMGRDEDVEKARRCLERLRLENKAEN